MMAAVQAIVVDRGIDAFSVDEVARRSGVAKSTIYRHFESGDDLLLAAIGDMLGAIPVIDTGSFAGDVRELLQGFVDLAARPEMMMLFKGVMHRAAGDPQFATLHQRIQDDRHRPIRAAVQRGLARGEIDPALEMPLITSLIEGPAISRLVHGRGTFRPGELDSLVALIARAVAPSA